MWIAERMEMCKNCRHSDHTHDEGDFHEVCEAGLCILCFQTGRLDCEEFEPKSEPEGMLLSD